MVDKLWCVTSSKEAGESLTATAVEASRWMLIEYNQPWGAKALLDSDLLEHIKSYLDALPDTRVQFIKQHNSSNAAIHVFVADTSDTRARLFETTVYDYEALRSMDIDAILRGETEFLPYDKPLFLVCCNGKRDLCCARLGLALYMEVSGKLHNIAWQTTHLGGHRFAPTALILPDGLAYGWIDDRADEVIQAYQRGDIVLDLYRGRVSYPHPAQAAETFLRQETGNLRIKAYQLAGMKMVAADEWEVTFQEPATNMVHIILVRMFMSDFVVYKSTGDEQPAHVPQFEQL
ncbi:MAG: hypothetical protein L0154_09830 [Chloroflexi bacterium]|nr:hypothetical protein [Chloroflexota bacterium]